ncbi:MAG: phosphatase PAP2 family protein, partial [Fidelibacterota bacterium]
MSTKRFLFAAIFLLNVNFSEAGEQRLEFLPELAEWSAAGLIFYTAYRLDHQPAWADRCFFNQPDDKPYCENTVSTTTLYTAAGLTGLGIGLIPNADGWLKLSAYHHSKGLMQTLAFSYLATNITKNIVGRRRPCFTHYPADDRIDAGKSFPSGHTSISFVIASYSSLYALDHFGGENKTGSWIYAVGSHALAAYVGYTRIVDNRHFLSDVIAGGLLGSGVTWLVYEYQQRKLTSAESSNEVSKSLIPVFLTV